MRALFPLEADTERIAERFLHRVERAHRRDLDAGAGFACVACEEGCEILRRGDARRAEQCAAEKLPEAFVVGVSGILAKRVNDAPER